MATTQSRRTISITGVTYAHLRAYAETVKRSMSDIVEQLLAGVLEQPVPPKRGGQKPSTACIDCPAPADKHHVRCAPCGEKHRIRNRQPGGEPRSASARYRGKAPPQPHPYGRGRRVPKVPEKSTPAVFSREDARAPSTVMPVPTSASSAVSRPGTPVLW